MRGCFVVGTDTGVGKTVLAAAVVAALVRRSETVAAFKPVVTGLDATPSGERADHELLGLCAGLPPDAVAPVQFGPPVSPHLAAGDAQIDVQELLERARSAAAKADVLIVEGVGGVLVPLARDWDIRRFARELALPLVVAARPGLGTINHTLLTLEAARAAGLEVRGVVLTPWPGEPGPIERSNAETIGRLGDVGVSYLPLVQPLEPGPLGLAGAALPIDAWVSPARA